MRRPPTPGLWVRSVLQLVCFACLFAAWVLGEANRTRYVILGAIAFTAGIAWVVFLMRSLIAQWRARHHPRPRCRAAVNARGVGRMR